jgi:hypothetical protein
MAPNPDFSLMNTMQCQQLIDEYLCWLKQEFAFAELEGSCQISTPFLDRHNDAIEVYIEKRNGLLYLTDDGYTIRDLRFTNMEFTTDKRKAHLTAVLNAFGVKFDNDEICVEASSEDFPQKKHNLLQAILAINDMFVMAEEHVLSLFKEDVALFLEAHHIPAFSDFKLSGKSGLDHEFDFGLPKTAEKPQRLLQAINNLNKDNATSLAFAVADIRAIRPEPVGALAFINDSIRLPNEEHLAALRVYDVEPLIWSHRQEFVLRLNGSPR